MTIELSKAFETTMAPGFGEEERTSMFGHHPTPAVDFEIEVEALQARLFDAKGGISKPGEEPESLASVRLGIEQALMFRVGGDQGAVAAKATLRALQAEVVAAINALAAERNAKKPQPAGDHERIWLQNAADADHQREGRLWCQDKVWPEDDGDGEPTEYVRADRFGTLEAALRSIAGNTCCEGCQEARLVAEKSLRDAGIV